MGATPHKRLDTPLSTPYHETNRVRLRGNDFRCDNATLVTERRIPSAPMASAAQTAPPHPRSGRTLCKLGCCFRRLCVKKKKNWLEPDLSFLNPSLSNSHEGQWEARVATESSGSGTFDTGIPFYAGGRERTGETQLDRGFNFCTASKKN